MWNAITQYCSNPDSVIVTLDADDALLGPHALDRVLAEYEDGADVTVGSMLRLDKEADYPVDFDDPRSRSSNVWQHLRTFRKYLFDAICVDDLKINGGWIELANDWRLWYRLSRWRKVRGTFPNRFTCTNRPAPRMTTLGTRETV